MPIKIKRTYASPEEIDETFRPLFVEKDGKQVLDIEIEGLVPASKLEEFRQTNINDRQRFEAELAKFKDVDVEKYQDLLSRERDLSDGKLIKRGEIETVVKPRIEEALKPVREELQAEKGKTERLKTQLASAIIENKALEAAVPLGLKKGAARDLIRRATEIFKLNDEGEVVAYEKDGKTPKYHHGDPYTIDQFVKDTATSDDGKHLFEDNAGGGGDPSKGNGTADFNGINPWDPKTLNRTLQGQILTKNRALAVRLAAKHGVKIDPVAVAG